MQEEQKTGPELDLKAAAVEQLPLGFYSSGISDTKVLRFRRSHHIAAHSLANCCERRNQKSTRKPVILVRFLNLKFLKWTRSEMMS
jgi:hypothetical protein